MGIRWTYRGPNVGKNSTIPMPGTYDPLPAHLVSELVTIGYREESVRHWSIEKARVTLKEYKTQADVALLRADLRAGEIDGAVKPAGGWPLTLMRQAAAVWVGQALAANNVDDLVFAVQGAVAELTNDELRALGGYMSRKLLGDGT